MRCVFCLSVRLSVCLSVCIYLLLIAEKLGRKNHNNPANSITCMLIHVYSYLARGVYFYNKFGRTAKDFSTK